MNCVNWRTIEIKKCCNTDFVKYFYRLAVIWAVNERAMGGYGWDENWTAEKRRMRRGGKILACARAFPGISHFLLSQPSPMRLFAIHFAPRADAFLWGKSGFF